MPLSRLFNLQLLFKIQKEIQLPDPGVAEALFFLLLLLHWYFKNLAQCFLISLLILFKE